MTSHTYKFKWRTKVAFLWAGLSFCTGQKRHSVSPTLHGTRIVSSAQTLHTRKLKYPRLKLSSLLQRIFIVDSTNAIYIALHFLYFLLRGSVQSCIHETCLNSVLSWCIRLCSTTGNIGLFLGLKSDIMVTQFPRYDSQKGLDKPV